MILVDTGPLVALFDPRDDAHAETRTLLALLREPLFTTVAVPFHLLDPGSRGSADLREFITAGGMNVWFLSADALTRCFELIEQYADHPMDLADASLVTAAEHLRTTRVFTLDRRRLRYLPGSHWTKPEGLHTPLVKPSRAVHKPQRLYPGNGDAESGGPLSPT